LLVAVTKYDRNQDLQPILTYLVNPVNLVNLINPIKPANPVDKAVLAADSNEVNLTNEY